MSSFQIRNSSTHGNRRGLVGVKGHGISCGDFKITSTVRESEALLREKFGDDFGWSFGLIVKRKSNSDGSVTILRAEFRLFAICGSRSEKIRERNANFPCGVLPILEFVIAYLKYSADIPWAV